jgi:CxxC motif-containing protein (DUF1111 family)
MKLLKIFVMFVFALALTLPFAFTTTVEGQALEEAPTVPLDTPLTDDNIFLLFNEFGDLGAPVDEETNPPVAGRSFRDNLFIFGEQETKDDGLGPVYNARGCGECHDSTVVGGRSQISELRAGRTVNGVFTANDPDGSLINQRAISGAILERVAANSNNRGLRMTISIIGDGFLECINSNDLVANANAQPAAQRGILLQVPVIEGNGAARTGRFGWKGQHASLLSFAGDAYLNEMGITNPFDGHGGLVENTSNGNSVAAFDSVADPEDDGDDVEAFAQFMRQTNAPGRGPQNATTNAGSTLFNQIGCNVCHTRTFNTLPAGTLINNNQFTVPAELGSEIVHPFSDLALHDIGTGDGIPGPAGTNNLFRTIPLWGLRTAPSMFMHDGLSFSLNDAIQRHGGQATTARNNFNNALSAAQRAQVIAFLNSL